MSDQANGRGVRMQTAIMRKVNDLRLLPGICLAPKERRWERGVYAASTHDCPQATDSSNALLLAPLKRRERRAPLNTYWGRG